MDQSAPPGSAGANNLTKGRRRDQGAVKISCARQDPNARNCHGYRKFVKRSVLENPAAGYLVNDTLVIRYTIELVVSTGGALAKPNGRIGGGGGLGVGSLRGLGGRGGNRGGGAGGEGALLPPPSLGVDLARLLDSGAGADVEFEVEGELFSAHRIVLSARSPVFDALLNGGMREAREVLQLGGAAGAQDGGDDAERRPSPASCGGSPPPLLPRIKISDVRAPVFRALLHFAYTDELPSEIGSTSGGSAGGGEAAAATSAGEAAAAPSTALAVAAPSSRPPAATTTAAFAAALSTVGAALDVPMAQHLLVAADRFALSRLRRICERRLCERVDISTAATTLALAEQNNASDLKRVCLAFVSRNLQAVMASEGYQHMVRNFFFCRFVFSSLCFSPGFFISRERNRSNGKKKKTHSFFSPSSLSFPKTGPILPQPPSGAPGGHRSQPGRRRRRAQPPSPSRKLLDAPLHCRCRLFAPSCCSSHRLFAPSCCSRCRRRRQQQQRRRSNGCRRRGDGAPCDAAEHETEASARSGREQ